MKTDHIYLYLSLLCLLFLGSCSSKQPHTEESELVVVNVEKSYPVKKLKLQDIAKVEYLPLETTDEFLWSRGGVNTFSDKYITNFNREKGDLLIFDRNGKGVATFNRQGGSGEEYAPHSDLMLDEENNEIIVNDNNQKKIVVYDMEGTFKRVMYYAEDKWYLSLVNYDKNTFIAYNRQTEDEKENSFLFLSKTTGEVIEEMVIPATGNKLSTRIETSFNGQRATISFAYYPITIGESDFILNEVSNDTLFALSPSRELRPIYVQTPSRGTMDPQVFLYLNKESDRYAFFNTMDKKIDLSKGQGPKNRYLVYDKQEKAFYESEIFNDDYTIDLNLFLHEQHFIQRNQSVQELNTINLIQFYENNALQGKLKEIAANLDEED
ncbi:6-bladed beta-propeller, partial [Parabacteroides sp. OttesenSCG-928-J18]|nr:6-bladed beta-propeller [Parabacteroides sp. OttesenSCG-928-J18]